MDISEIPGAGAAGGLGGGVLPFLNAELQSGIDIVLDMLRFLCRRQWIGILL